MAKVHVFNAGPCLLPQAVIDASIEALKDFKGTGVSVLSISHRTKEWEATMNECRALWKELLNIPEGYEVLFLGGGASLEFLYVAMNFLEKKAAYLDTGVWAHKALKEAQGLGEAYAIACSKDKNYSYIPKGFEIPSDLDYLHITTNNTIYGTEIREDMDCPVPLIADMSSDILSRPVDVSKYTMIYGGAQKNAGPAGVAFVIVKKDALGKVSRYLPTMLDYRTHVDKGCSSGCSAFSGACFHRSGPDHRRYADRHRDGRGRPSVLDLQPAYRGVATPPGELALCIMAGVPLNEADGPVEAHRPVQIIENLLITNSLKCSQLAILRQ